MFQSISIFLWALFFGGPNSGDLAGRSGSIHPIAIADSTVLHTLQQRVAMRQQQNVQEKIYLHLDRTLLKPGETVWFNAFIRNAHDLMPSQQSEIIEVQLIDARGSVIQTKRILALGGTAPGEFDFPAYLPGGLYKIRAYSNWMRNFSTYFEREITLQKVVLPSANLKLEFERKGLGAGDVAIARFDGFGLDNKAISLQKLLFTVSIGGQQIQTAEAQTDVNGRAYLRFQLPETLTSSDGILNVQLEHRGLVESISRPIPIVLQHIDLQFFPEGGDAIANLPCQMAFKAANEFGKPADVSGIIQDQNGTTVATFSSFHDGMGSFHFTPKAGDTYQARITQPSNIARNYPLPTIFPDGAVLHLAETTAEHTVFQISGKQSQKLYLTGQSQDKIFFYKEIQITGIKHIRVTVPTSSLPIGIARFTLFDQHANPMAERLAFLHRDRGLQVSLTTNKEKYLPREKVDLQIRVSDHAGNPVKGKFSLAVTDESLLTYADDKKGHLLASLLLEQDVKGVIENPNFYFDTTEEKAPAAMDFLLMTQGWRRFTWKTLQEAPSIAIRYPAEHTDIGGTILQKNGNPAKNAKVRLHPNGPETQTDEYGNFLFRQVDLNQHMYLVSPYNEYFPISKYSTQIIRRENGVFDYATILQKHHTSDNTTSITGLIEDGQEPLTGATITATNTNGQVKGAVANMDGIYQMELPTGIYTFVVSSPGFQSQVFNNVEITKKHKHYLSCELTQGYTLGEVVATENRTAVKPTKTMPLSEADLRAAPVEKLVEVVTEQEIAKMDDDRPLMESVVVTTYKVPLISADKTAGGQTLNAEQLQPRSMASNKKSAQKAKRMPYDGRPRQIFSAARQFYAPVYSQQQQPAARNDFRTTIYWNPTVFTDKNGTAQVSFYTSDANTNFRMTLEGIGEQGQAGRGVYKFYVQKPLEIAVKTPPSVMTGDTLRLQIAVKNNTTYPGGGTLMVQVPEHFTPVSNNLKAGKIQVSMAPGSAAIVEAAFKIGLQIKENQEVTVKLAADETTTDAISVNIKTLFAGYPAQQVVAGLGAKSTFNVQLIHPIDGTVSATLNAYPTILDDVLKGMERMLRQPSGCFEQVSSSNYPNLLVLDLLRQTGDQRPEVEALATQYLEDGYKKLVAYECKSGGFDWWGRDPGHEGLTAYGILEFTDMARVFPVDKAMIDRTVQWISSRRNGKGGWTLNPTGLHGWQSDPILNCYISWALAEAKYAPQFLPEINEATAVAMTSNDPYLLALMANARLAMGDEIGNEILEQLLKKQEINGSWVGTTHSVMYGYGDCFRIETTALAALAMMKTQKNSVALQKAMDYLFKSKTGYGYGSTQSTVVTLKALIEFIKLDKKTAKTGSFQVLVDGKRAGTYTFATKSGQKLEIKDLNQFFSHDHPKIEVVFDDPEVTIPFDLEVKYASRQPQDAANCPLAFSTSLDKVQTTVGETVRITATLQNKQNAAQASPMIVLGIPSGLSLQPWQLKKLVDEKQVDYYELWDGFAVFHFETLAANTTKNIALDLRADIPGVYEAPASQAFLYYTNDKRVWSKPEKVTIH